MPRGVADAYRLHHEIQYVGKTIKASKRRVTWKFVFEGDKDEHSVVLLHTLNSGKKVVFLNGTQIYEDDKMTMSQWVYPFQVEGHLLTVMIEAAGTFSDEKGYDLQIDGRPWLDLRVTTLMDMHSRGARGGGGGGGRDAEAAASAWGTRSDAGGGRSADLAAAAAPASRRWDEATPEDDGDGGFGAVRTGASSSSARRASGTAGSTPPVPVKSMSDFIGGGGAPAAGGGGEWDPFKGDGGASGGGDDFDAPAPRPAARASATAALRAAAPAAATAPGSALRPPPAATHARSHAAAAAHHVPAPAPAAPAPAPVASVTDDLAGLSFGGGDEHHPAASASGFGYDPFASSGPASAPASAHSTPAHGGGGIDIFSQPPVAVPISPFPLAALAGATSSGSATAVGAAYVPAASPGILEGGLINLDNITDTGAKPAAGASKAAPSLAQLKATTAGPAGGLATAPKSVMSGGITGTTGLGAMSSGLGDPFGGPPQLGGYRPAPGYGGPAPGYGGPAPGYGGPAPGYGGPAPGFGGYGAAPGGFPGGGYPAPQYGAPAGGLGGFGAQAPAPAQAPQDYNPFA